jgi:hypothetical protein
LLESVWLGSPNFPINIGGQSSVKCFVTFRLKPGVSIENYESWFRSSNLPAVAKQTATRNLRVWHKAKIHEGQPSWDIIEEMEVEDMAQAAHEFRELPEMQRMLREWRELVDDEAVVFTEELEQEE